MPLTCAVSPAMVGIACSTIAPFIDKYSVLHLIATTTLLATGLCEIGLFVLFEDLQNDLLEV